MIFETLEIGAISKTICSQKNRKLSIKLKSPHCYRLGRDGARKSSQKSSQRVRRVPGQSGLAERGASLGSRARAAIHSLSVCFEPTCGLSTFSAVVVIIPNAFLRSEKCSFRKTGRVEALGGKEGADVR